MPEPGITLDADQAEELRELITLTGIVQEWLHYAGDIILDNLADRACHDTFHPRSYAAWLLPEIRRRPARDGGCMSVPSPGLSG